jgi:phage replication O-like protein O
MPELKEGFTPIPNNMLLVMIQKRINPTELKIILAVIYKTLTWHKEFDRISFSQFEELTDLNRRHISPSLQSLIKRNIIIRKGEGYNLEYGIQTDIEKWVFPEKIVTDFGNEIVTEISNESLPKEPEIITENSNESLPKQVTIKNIESLPLSPKSLPLSRDIVTDFGNEIVTENGTHKRKKETTTKETIQKKVTNVTPLPDFLKKENWEAFKEMRKKIRAPMTDKAEELIIKDLERIRGQTEDDPNEVLEQSISRCWRGVFPLKNRGGYGVNRRNSQTNTNGQSLTERLKASARVGDGQTFTG